MRTRHVLTTIIIALAALAARREHQGRAVALRGFGEIKPIRAVTMAAMAILRISAPSPT
jgi:hypothetical protein